MKESKVDETKNQPVIAALRGKRYAEAERLASGLLQSQPLLAQAWVFLGEALMHQGYGLAAQRAFDRGWLLDPQAGWVAGVRQALAKVPPGPVQANIEALLKVKPVTVAAGILVKDEARCIRRCLDSLTEAVDEIVVFDTGSTDGTPAIAAAYDQVKVVHIPWQDDFAAVRNACLEHIESDWLLCIDADEYLHVEDRKAVREAAGLFDFAEEPVVLNVGQLNLKKGRVLPNYDQSRMFPLRRGLRYHGRIHEQVMVADGEGQLNPPIRKAVRVRLWHDGYDDPIIKSKDKFERNLKLLRHMVQDEPENPGWWFFYGRETLGSGDAEGAVSHLENAFRLAAMSPQFGRTLDVIMLLVKIHWNAGRREEAEMWCRRALEIRPDFPDAAYWLARIEMKKAADLLKEAEQRLEAINQTGHKYRGTVSADPQILGWHAGFASAELLRTTGRLAQAEAMYRKLLSVKPKQKEVIRGLKWIGLQREALNRIAGDPDPDQKGADD